MLLKNYVTQHRHTCTPLAELPFYLKVLYFKSVTGLVKGKVVPTHVMKAYRRSGIIDPIILNLGAR